MNRTLTSRPVARVNTDQPPGPGPWVFHAACAGLPTRYFFSDNPADTEVALTVCQPCPVRNDCAAYALAIPILDGVWGGLTEADRRRSIRRRTASVEVCPLTPDGASVPFTTHVKQFDAEPDRS